MAIYIIGMGVSNAMHLSNEQMAQFNRRSNVFRTDHHQVAEHFKTQAGTIQSYDGLYETADSLAAVYEAILVDLKERLKKGEDFNYWVPGHPLIGEETVRLLLESGEIDSAQIHILPAMSYLDVASVALKKPIAESIRIHDAYSFRYFETETAVDQIFVPLDSSFLASEIKEKLLEVYFDEYEVVVIQSPGTSKESIKKMKLQYLDDLTHYDHETMLYVPKNENHPYGFSDLVETIHHLRSPEGCPWDRKQTHLSLREYVVEESYEVIDAIEKEDYNSLEEELGDLLLQIVLHAEIGQEIGYFNIFTVIHRLVEKLIRRHPHVYGNSLVDSVEQVEQTWNAVKKKEKPNNSIENELKNLPKLLPNLTKSYKIQKKASYVGFDWPHVEGALLKLDEEVDEMKAAIQQGNLEGIEEELGDLLFATVNVARKLHLNPELALGKANDKFIKRFLYIESHLGKPLQEATLEEMDELWNEAKCGYKNQA